MSWLERVRRRELGRAETTELLIIESPELETTATRSVRPETIDGSDVEYRRRSPFVRLVRAFFKPWSSLTLFVIVPSAVVCAYYSFIATDQYVVESHFVVRQIAETSIAKGTITLESAPQGAADQTKAGESKAATSAGSPRSTFTTDDKDAYVVSSYIASPAIVDRVSEDLNVADFFRRPEADFWARLENDASQEDLQRYWLNMVSAYVDRSSGIITLEVRAFRREDALMLSNAIIAAASTLLNDMSLRARNDALARAHEEVEKADHDMHVVMIGLENFRNREGLIDPVNVATNTGDLLKRLLGKRIAIDTELYVTKNMRPDAPTIPALVEQLKALDARIGELRATLTVNNSADTRAISTTLVGYDELEVKEAMAKEIYIAARAAEENAQETAERRWLYLASFDPPTLPDDSEYPRRIGFSAIAITVLFALWSIAALIWASVLDHRT